MKKRKNKTNWQIGFNTMEERKNETKTQKGREDMMMNLES